MSSNTISKRGFSWTGRETGGAFGKSSSFDIDGSSHSYSPLYHNKRNEDFINGQKTQSYRRIQLQDKNSTILTMTSWKSDSKSLLVTGSIDSIVNVWDIVTGSILHSLARHKDCVRCVVTSKDEEEDPVVVSASADKTLIIWSLLRGQMLHQLFGHSHFVTTVALSKNSAYPVIVSGSWDKTIKTWDLKTGDLLRSTDAHSAPITCLAISSGMLPVIISGSEDDVMKIWDLASGTLLHILSGHHQSRISAVAISTSDGVLTNPILVSGASNGTILMWDLLSLSIIFTLTDPDLTSHNLEITKSEISSVVITDTSVTPLIVTTSWDKTIRIWDMKTGLLLRIIEGHRENIYSLTVGYDDKEVVIISGGADSFINLWTVETDLLTTIENYESIDRLDLEESLSLVGKFIIYWKLIYKSDKNVNKSFILSSQQSCLTFYSMLRSGKLNPKLLRTNVGALSFLLSASLQEVDLLKYDHHINGNSIQFLLENRLCIGRVQEWIQVPKNMTRVIHILSDSFQSTGTLDSILSAVLGTDQDGSGWNMLEDSTEFREIFRNLLINSPRSHKRLIEYLRFKGLRVENEPYPSPLNIPAYATCLVTRWKDVAVSSGSGQPGVYCYRIRMNTALDMDFLLSQEFTNVIASSPVVVSFVSIELIEYIIQYKWESWGFFATLVNGIFFCVYLIATSCAMLWICGDYTEMKLEHTFLFLFSLTCSLLCNALYLGLTLYQLTSISLTEYATNLWNMSELLMLSFCIVSLMIGFTAGPTHLTRSLCTGLTLLIWSRTLYFGRGSFPFATLIDAMKHIIFDMRYFILVLALFLTTFAVAFRVLGVFESLHLSFLLCFNMMLGDIDINYVRGHNIAQMLYITFLVSVAIVMLNSLIAFMEHSLQAARQRSHTAALVSRIKLLREIEIKMKPLSPFISFLKRRLRKREDAGELVILVPESEGKPNFLPLVPDHQKVKDHVNDIFQKTQEDIMDIKSSIGKDQISNNTKIKQMEMKIQQIDTKLDQILSMLTAERSRRMETESSSGNLDLLKSPLPR